MFLGRGSALRLPFRATTRVRPYKIQNVFLNIYNKKIFPVNIVWNFPPQNLQQKILPYSVDPNFAVFAYLYPPQSPRFRGEVQSPPREGELEGVNLDLLILSNLI